MNNVIIARTNRTFEWMWDLSSNERNDFILKARKNRRRRTLEIREEKQQAIEERLQRARTETPFKKRKL